MESSRVPVYFQLEVRCKNWIQHSYHFDHKAILCWPVVTSTSKSKRLAVQHARLGYLWDVQITPLLLQEITSGEDHQPPQAPSKLLSRLSTKVADNLNKSEPMHECDVPRHRYRAPAMHSRRHACLQRQGEVTSVARLLRLEH